MEDPITAKGCPHPTRNGWHEVYGRPDGSTFCRACGKEFERLPYSKSQSSLVRIENVSLRGYHAAMIPPDEVKEAEVDRFRDALTRIAAVKTPADLNDWRRTLALAVLNQGE